MLAFMCRDPADTMSKVSCCVEPSWCFKNSNFDATYERTSACSTPFKISLPKNETTVSAFFFRNYAFTQRFDSYTFTNTA